MLVAVHWCTWGIHSPDLQVWNICTTSPYQVHICRTFRGILSPASPWQGLWEARGWVLVGERCTPPSGLAGMPSSHSLNKTGQAGQSKMLFNYHYYNNTEHLSLWSHHQGRGWSLCWWCPKPPSLCCLWSCCVCVSVSSWKRICGLLQRESYWSLPSFPSHCVCGKTLGPSYTTDTKQRFNVRESKPKVSLDSYCRY